MSTPLIREGRPSDRPFLLEILTLSAVATYPPLGNLGRLTLRDTIETFYDEYDHPQKRLWVAEVDGKPASAIWGLRSIHPVLEEAELLVVAIATLPDFQGRGLARALLAHAAESARSEGLKALRLFANPANEQAMALYQQDGFQSLTVELRKPIS